MKHKKFSFIIVFSLCFSLFLNNFLNIFASEIVQNEQEIIEENESTQTEQIKNEEEIQTEQTEIIEEQQEEIEESQTNQTENIEEIQTEQIIEEEEEQKEEEIVVEKQEVTKTMAATQVKRSNPAATLKSYGLPVMNIQLSGVTLDQINAGTKDIKYEGNSVSISGNGVDFIADNVTIKGHGNSSWKDKKKPYQIKFDSKESLFGMPAAKKYLLIANYRDGSLLRNAICYDLAAALGISPSSYQFIDLYVNQAYVGNYMLIQKVENGKNSVNLKDPTGIIAEIDIHPDTDDITFRSSYSNALISLKDSNDDYQTGIQYFLTDFQKAEQYAKQKNWGQLCKLIDVDSFAKYYLLSEISSNPDAQRSSCYIVKDGAADVLHAGPAWDFDRAFGNYYNEYYTDPYYGSIYNDPRVQEQNGTKIYSDMMKIPEFREVVENMWRQSFKAQVQAEYSKITNMNNAIQASAAADHQKWGTSSDLSAVKKFIERRIEYLDMLFGQNVSLDTTQQYKITNGDFCISTANPTTTNGESATLRKQRIKESQLFTLELTDNGHFYIIKQVSSGYALTVKDNLLTKKCDVVLLKNNNTDAQKWRIIKKNNKYVIMSKLNGMVFDVRGGVFSSGTQIQMYHYNGTNSQFFSFVKNPHPFTTDDMSGTYVILNTASNYMVAIAGDSKQIRANVQGSNSYIQNNWYTIKKHSGNYYMIQNNRSKYFLDVQGGGTSDKTNVQQYKSNGTASQDWAFIKNSDGSFLIISRQNGLVLNLSGNNINVRKSTSSEKHNWFLLKKR